MVCTGCGMVCDDIRIRDVPETPYDFNGVSFYLHRNYFAERMAQWCITDPPFTTNEKVKYRLVGMYCIKSIQNYTVTVDYLGQNSISDKFAEF